MLRPFRSVVVRLLAALVVAAGLALSLVDVRVQASAGLPAVAAAAGALGEPKPLAQGSAETFRHHERSPGPGWQPLTAPL